MNLPRDPGPAKDRKHAASAATSRSESSPDPAAHGLRPGLDGLRDLMDRLLAPGGCPWDREQTLETLKPYLIEEAYEVLDAMHEPEAHRRELGDLLLQIVFQSALREREGAFDLDGVIAAIRDKMIRRHPHVFDPGAAPAADAAAVTRQWAQIKEQERGAAAGPKNPLAGVPRTLPALQRAWRLQDKAAAVGFDWPSFDGAVAKIREEWEELDRARESGDLEHVREEFGDLLFVLVRYGQKLGLAAEDALRATCAKFEARFAYVMQACHDRGIDPDSAGLAVLDGFWDEAKARGIRPRT
ncbi:MAG: nucleoside triphosphate pyrophosphohydrolase [Myxococcales bacterium]|nr:nucleoside triphosphate pyrophosphohydrolase [Myxococcales bacterium]